MIWNIFAIVLVAYGVTSDVMLYPDASRRNIKSIFRLLKRAYFALLGIIDLGEMQGMYSKKTFGIHILKLFVVHM